LGCAVLCAVLSFVVFLHLRVHFTGFVFHFTGWSFIFNVSRHKELLLWLLLWLLLRFSAVLG